MYWIVQNTGRWRGVMERIKLSEYTFRVEWVSPISAGVTVQMIQVLAFPPSDGCNILVNLESRNGMWVLHAKREGSA